MSKSLKIIDDETTDKDFDNNLDVIKFCSEVHSKSFKKSIKQDLVLATLDDKERQYCKEMIRNAYFTKKIMEQVADEIENRIIKTKTTKIAIKWMKENYAQQIRIIATQTFQTLILPVDATAILNRNRPNNHLLRLILGLEETQQTMVDPRLQPTPGAINYVKDKLAPQQEQQNIQYLR